MKLVCSSVLRVHAFVGGLFSFCVGARWGACVSAAIIHRCSDVIARRAGAALYRCVADGVMRRQLKALSLANKDSFW